MKKEKYIFVKKEGKFVQEHRLIAEKILNRKLKEKEVIHHKNGVKTDNDPLNLMLFENQKSHQTFHNKIKRFGYLTNPMKREIIIRSLI